MPEPTKIARGRGWELRLGNCLRDEWPECDHVITDTPYSEHVHGHHRRSSAGGGRKNVQIGFAPFDPFDIACTAIKVAQSVRRWVLLFSEHERVGTWNEALDFAALRRVRVGCWHKPDAMPQITGDRPGQSTESIVIGHGAKGRSRWNGGGSHAHWSYPVRDGAKRIHPTQKPLALLERLVELFTDAEDLILDPFAGSASSGVAAVRWGRRWVGWERDPKFFELARRRLEATHEQPRLFAANSRPRARQGALAL
jgi:site-specific DNA-methyltransferase (adenine-specific)